MGQRPLIAIAAAAGLLAGSAGAQAPGAEIGQEEFGLTERQLSEMIAALDLPEAQVWARERGLSPSS